MSAILTAGHQGHRSDVVARGSVSRMVLFQAIVLGWAGSALGQGLYFEWPTRIYMERPTTTLFLSGEVDESSQETSDSKSERERLRRELELNIFTRGYIYHPALMTYSIRLRPEFRWQDTDTNTDEDESSSRSNFLGYNLGTTWLKEKPVTVSLTADRTRSEFSSRLAAETVIEASRYSGRAQYNSALLPTSISYMSLDEDVSGYRPSQTSDDRWDLHSMLRRPDNQTELRLELRDFDRSIDGVSTPSELLRVLLSNRLTLGQGDYARTSLSFFERSREDLDTSNLRIDGQLVFRHEHNLQSDYRAAYRRSDNDGSIDRSGSLAAGLRHQLYENLTTNLDLSAEKADSEFGSTDSYGGGLNVAYTRRIPWGQIRLYGSKHRSVRDDQRVAEFVPVRGAPYTFAGISTTIVLDDVNIDVDSIVITDVTGAIVYVLGFDYDVEVFGATTTVRRNSLGDIGDGETVLVDYVYVPNPPAKTVRESTGAGMSVSLWDRLSVSYDVHRSDEEVVKGLPPEFPLDSESRRLTARLNLGPSITMFEMSELISARAPRETTSLTQTLRFQPSRRLSLNLGGAYVRTKLNDTGEIVKSSGLNAGVSLNLDRFGWLKVAAFTRRSESDLRKEEHNGLDADYRWRFGAWRSLVRVRIQDNLNEFEDINWGRRTLYLEIKRRFN